MQRLFSICCISLFFSFFAAAWPAAGQEASQVLRSEYQGLCKSLMPETCTAVNKKAERTPLEITRIQRQERSLHQQQLFQRRTAERYAERIERTAQKRSASKSGGRAVAANEQDSLALVAFYNALSGDNWTDNTGWLASPVSDWVGVLLNESGRVIELSLRSNQLFGTLPAEMSTLTELLFLDLFDNFLIGEIPNEITTLVNLEVLDLSFNLLSGPIPNAVGNMTRLFELILWGNGLSGEIPMSIVNLFNLEVLSIEFNDLEGPIPAEFGLLSSLQALYVDENELTGPIPPELGNLGNLISLFLGGNNLTGSIPPEITSIDGLAVLSVSNAGLSGPLPSEIGNLSQLTDLDLSINNFEGSIPDEYQQLFFLGNLYLNDNFLSGPIPTDLGFNLVNLVELSLGGNFFTGSIPPSIGQLLVLRFLDLGFNQLTGTIPDMNNNQRMRFLYLDQNDLSGEITNQFIALFAFTEVNLSGNNLSGSIPVSFAASPFMERLWLADNGFIGAIPPELTTLENLTTFDLWNNELEGPIPSGVVNQVNLQTIDFGWNQLTGSLPEGMDQLDQLQNLFLDINALSGPVTESLTGADTIRVLILNDNFLTRVPDLSQVTSLDSVALGNNWLGFDSIEPNLNTADGRITYAPQRPLPVLVNELETTIQFTADVGGSANEYQWFLGNTSLNGANESVYEAPYAGLTTSDELVLEIFNNQVPNLILATEPVRADARLSQVIIAPPIQSVAPGETVQFEYVGIDQFGNVRRFSGSWAAEGGTIDQSGVYVAGNEPGQYEISVNNSLGVQVGSLSINITTSVSTEDPGNTIEAYALKGNFPNPFHAHTELTIEIPKAGHIALHVYNVLGQKVETLLDEMMQPGVHRVQVDAGQWPAGLYFYTLQGDGVQETRTMVKGR